MTILTKQNYLALMGIEQWHLRENGISDKNNNKQNSVPIQQGPGFNYYPFNKTPKPPYWDHLQKCVSVCTGCDLYRNRTQTVFGTGNDKAQVMFIGEAPGAEEDRQGKPFVGRAGQLLTQMLNAIEFRRESIFIANILKCRPPNNRDPSQEEVKQCTGYLLQQINFIKPELLVALGRVAAHYLLNTKTALSKLRGQVFEYHKTPLIVTYHPAYLLRAPHDKSKSYTDLKLIRAHIEKSNK